MNLQEAIKEFKDKGVSRGEMEFSAGGDSMSDYTITLFDENDNEVNNVDVLVSFLEDEIFRRVTFYEVSDGHYMGESGVVHIELNGDDEDEDFYFSKSAEAEWNEHIDSELKIKLTQEQADFIRKNISSVNGGYDEGVNINYSRDFIMTDKDEATQKSIEELIEEETANFSPDIDEECNDWFRYEGEGELVDEENNLVINITNEYYTYTDSD